MTHRFNDRPRCFDQMGPHLLEKVPPLIGRQRLHQVLFSRGQNAREADRDEVADEVRVNVLGPSAHVVLFEAVDRLADGGFELTLGFHAAPRYVAVPISALRPRIP
jgi:hypothetical protein